MIKSMVNEYFALNEDNEIIALRDLRYKWRGEPLSQLKEGQSLQCNEGDTVELYRGVYDIPPMSPQLSAFVGKINKGAIAVLRF